MLYKFRDYDFEIADDWLEEAGVSKFSNACADAGFVSDASAEIVSLQDIKTPKRDAETLLFSEARMMNILKGIAEDAAIPPIEICIIEDGEFKYKLKDGFHRFYASVALSFEVIPAIVVEDGPREMDLANFLR